MSKQLALSNKPKDNTPLGKEQRAFNQLVKKLRVVRAEIEEARDGDLRLRRLGEEQVKPAEVLAITAHRDWVMVLHNNPHQAKLSQKAAQKFPKIMLSEVQFLLNTSVFGSDPDVQALYAHYEGNGRTYEEIQEAREHLFKEMTAQMMDDMFGVKLDAEDFDDPAAMHEKLKQREAEFEAEAQARAEKRAQRKQSDAQRAAAEKRSIAEQTVKKTTKQIYLDLVRHFHPDQERDAALRHEKTEQMKQITVAYEADDYLKLIELQLTLLDGRSNAVTGFDKEQLKYFNNTLRQQLYQLQEELYHTSPAGSGNIYAKLYHPDPERMLYIISRHVASVKQQRKMTLENIRVIQDLKIFKEFVRDYSLPDDDIGDFFLRNFGY